jgi:hypothetical protein
VPIPVSTASDSDRPIKGAGTERQPLFSGLALGKSRERVKGTFPFSLRKACAKIGTVPEHWYTLSWGSPY